MGKPRIDEIEQAIIDAITNDPTMKGYIKGKVQTLSERNTDFSREQFIVNPPQVLVFLSGGSHSQDTIEGTMYRNPLTFLLVALARNMRGPDAARRGSGSDVGTYDILDDLRTLFAGKILTLATLGSANAPICLLGAINFESAQKNQMAYSLEIIVNADWDNLA